MCRNLKFFYIFRIIFSLAVILFFYNIPGIQAEEKNIPSSVSEAKIDSHDYSGLLKALKAKDLASVKGIMAESKNTPAFAEAEKYVMSAAREAVLRNDLDYARKLLEIILVNNIDNTRAQNLYASLAQEKKKEERRARQKKEEKPEKGEDIKDQEEIPSVMDRFSLLLDVMPFSFFYNSSEFADEYNSEDPLGNAYALSLGAGLRFNHPYVIAGLSAQYASTFFTDEESHRAITTVCSLGTPAAGIPLSLSGGFGRYAYKNPDGKPTAALYTEVNTPLLGISVDELVFLSDFDISLGLYMMLLSTQEKLLDNAFMMDYKIKYRMMKLSNTNHHICLIHSFDLRRYQYKSKSELDMYLSFGVGLLINANN